MTRVQEFCRRVVIPAALLLAVVAACEEQLTSPTRRFAMGTRDGQSHTEMYYDDYAPGDSSPAACLYFDCVSLTPEEKESMMNKALEGMNAAQFYGDGDCFTLFRIAYWKLDGNMVFKARAHRVDQYGPAPRTGCGESVHRLLVRGRSLRGGMRRRL
jgi:hypothetical protein